LKNGRSAREDARMQRFLDLHEKIVALRVREKEIRDQIADLATAMQEVVSGKAPPVIRSRAPAAKPRRGGQPVSKLTLEFLRGRGKEPVDLQTLEDQGWAKNRAVITSSLHQLAKKGLVRRAGRALWTAV
jgi:hypothetical protein